MLLAKVATTHPAPRASATCIHGLIGENYCGFWMLLEGLWHGAPGASLAKHCSLLFASRQCSNEGSMVFAGRPGRCSWPNRMTPNSSSRFGHPNYFLNPYSFDPTNSTVGATYMSDFLDVNNRRGVVFASLGRHILLGMGWWRCEHGFRPGRDVYHSTLKYT